MLDIFAIRAFESWSMFFFPRSAKIYGCSLPAAWNKHPSIQLSPSASSIFNVYQSKFGRSNIDALIGFIYFNLFLPPHAAALVIENHWTGRNESFMIADPYNHFKNQSSSLLCSMPRALSCNQNRRGAKITLRVKHVRVL